MGEPVGPGIVVIAHRLDRAVAEQRILDEQLAVTAEFFERELDYKLKKFTSLFEPIVIVAMGFIVAFVAIALVSAMYGIFHQVKLNG